MPKGYIKAIHITERTTLACTGTYTANTALKYIRVRMNGKLIVNVDGMSSVADKQSAGPELLRELCAQEARLAQTANYWELPFDPPLPPGDVELTFKFNTREVCGCSSADLVGSVDIEVEYVPAKIAKKTARVPYITSFMWTDAALTGNRYHLFPKIPDGMRLRILAFITHDEEVRSNTTYDSLIVEEKGNRIWSGKMSRLREEIKDRTGLALNTGCFIITFGKSGLKITPGTTLFKFAAATAGTLKYIELLAICY